MRASLAFLFLAACHGQEPPAKPQNVNTMLTATLSLARHDYAKDAEVEVTVDLANMTPNPVEIPAQTLDTAILLLDVSTAAGKHVDTMPPPVPREDKVTFAPNEHKTVKVKLDVFSPNLPSGDYIVGPGKTVANGNPVTFHIR